MAAFHTADRFFAMRYRDILAKRTKNTATARKLAEYYEQAIGFPFPGGTENAYIERLRPGHWQRSEGAWSWVLSSISMAWNEDHAGPQQFGSQYPAKQCVHQPELIDPFLIRPQLSATPPAQEQPTEKE